MGNLHRNMTFDELMEIRQQASGGGDDRAVRLVDEITRVYWATGDRLTTDRFKPRKWRCCTGCRDAFEVERLTNGRSPKCPACHAKRRRTQSEKSVLEKMTRDLGKAGTLAAMMNVVRMAALEFGSLEELMHAFLETLRDDSVTEHQRLRQYGEFVRLTAYVEEAKKAAEREWPKLEPEQVVRAVHSQGALMPVLRRMYAEGAFTLDQIDPPPVEVG